jgi:DNA-directed RNA polymerase specialized sigma24 family protein
VPARPRHTCGDYLYRAKGTQGRQQTSPRALASTSTIQTSINAVRRAARKRLDERDDNARVTMSPLTPEKIPREGKKTLASIVQRA